MVEFAKSELARIGGDEDGLQQLVNKNILEVIKVFVGQGHSGFSAGYVINILKKLLSWKPLTPLTGEEDEWNGEQNKRYGKVFRTVDGKAYNIEGKIFTDDGGKSWYTEEGSKVEIEFPYHVPDSPTRVYRFKYADSVIAPLGIKWTKVSKDGIEGEFYGIPNTMVEHKFCRV